MDQKEFDERVDKNINLTYGSPGTPLRIKGEDLSSVNMIEKDMSRVLLDRTKLRGADLSRSSMHAANIYNSDFDGATLEDVCLVRTLMSNNTFAKANLRGADLRYSVLLDVDFSGADLSGAMFADATFSNVKLKDAILSWNSCDLLAEVLWQAADGDAEKQQLAAFVGRRRDWCWENWIKLDHPYKEWAFKTLAARVRLGDNAPRSLRLVAGGMSVKDALAEWESFS